MHDAPLMMQRYTITHRQTPDQVTSIIRTFYTRSVSLYVHSRNIEC